MKIGILTIEEFDFNRFGGFGFVAQRVAFLLKEKGHEVSIIDISPPPNGETSKISEGVPVYFIRKKGKILVDLLEEYRSKKRLVALLKKLNLDRILIISEWAVRYQYYIKKSFPHLKSILWLQDEKTEEDWEKIFSLEEERQSSAYYKPWLFKFKSTYNNFVRKRGIDSVDVCVSQANLIKAKIKRLYGLSPKKISTLSNPIRIPLEKFGKNKKPTVVFLGRLDPIKRPWIFCEMAKIYKNVDFIVMGKSHNEELIRRKMAPYRNLRNLKFMGLTTGKKKEKILKKAWVLVNTSVYECLPVSFLEALSYKMALLSCQNPDGITKRFGYYTGEILGDGTSQTEKFAKGLGILLRDKRWKKLGKKGFSFVKNFSEENKIIDRLLKL